MLFTTVTLLLNEVKQELEVNIRNYSARKNTCIYNICNKQDYTRIWLVLCCVFFRVIKHFLSSAFLRNFFKCFLFLRDELYFGPGGSHRTVAH